MLFYGLLSFRLKMPKKFFRAEIDSPAADLILSRAKKLLGRRMDQIGSDFSEKIPDAWIRNVILKTPITSAPLSWEDQERRSQLENILWWNQRRAEAKFKPAILLRQEKVRRVRVGWSGVDPKSSEEKQNRKRADCLIMEAHFQYFQFLMEEHMSRMQ